ncbi:hypothetical protein NZNM25_19520 [Nitrosopumilus zosterae]|uniref:Acyl carrier protein n=2 Tax=Nitrosopumilus zosterae TaxID=718286 RepID=A0A2S2KU98_9ARCH|nr:hypothetical protein NZNM25_19520 [Nitrosopumilus zosterae]
MFANVMSNDKLKKMIKEIFFEIFPNLVEDDFAWGKKQNEYENWDSFAQLNLITFAEAKFNITFSLDESIEIKSANDLLKSIQSHLT